MISNRLVLTKRHLFVCLLFLNLGNTLSLCSQNIWNVDTITDIKWPVDSLASIERAYILNNRLYNPYFVSLDTVFIPKNGLVMEFDSDQGVVFANMRINVPRITIRTTKIDKDHWPIFNYTSYKVLNVFEEPIIWIVESDSIFRELDSFWGFSRNFRFSDEFLMQDDTISYRRMAKERWQRYEAGEITFDEVQKLNPLNKHDPYRNTRIVKSLESYFSYFSIPVFDKYRKISSYRNSSLKVEEYWNERSISWDVARLYDRDYLLLLRTENCLISWLYYYPNLGELDRLSDRQIHCYCSTDAIPEVLSSDSLVAKGIDLESYNNWIDFESLPNYNEVVFNAFPDRQFFDGHFKTYRNNGDVYIINQKHGNIYYLGENRVECIGRIEVENYKYKIDNIRVFIEDMDNNRIIVFAHVQWFSSDYPLPPIISITEEAQLFKELGRAVELVTKVE